MKNQFSSGVLALLVALGLVSSATGLTYLSLSGVDSFASLFVAETMDTKDQMQPTSGENPSYSCDELKMKMAESDPSSDMYAQWKAKYTEQCTKTEDTNSTNTSTDKNKTDDKTDARDTSDDTTGDASSDDAKLCADLEAKLSTMDSTSEEYLKLKLEYNKRCHPEDSSATGDDNDQKSSDDNFQPELSDCKEMRLKLVRMLNAGLGDSADYAELKTEFVAKCKFLPVAFEDKVSEKCDENPFPDTDSASLDGKAACELYKRGVIGGYDDGEFKGENPVNRAEAAKFLLLACNKKDQGRFSGKFHDVGEGQWYTPFVEAAAEQGVINGYSDGSFKPGNTVNRAEFLKMISKACELPEKDGDLGDFSDVKAGDWFVRYLRAARMFNLLPDANLSGQLDAGRLMTRREVAEAIYQFLANRDASGLQDNSGTTSVLDNGF